MEKLYLKDFFCKSLTDTQHLCNSFFLSHSQTNLRRLSAFPLKLFKTYSNKATLSVCNLLSTYLWKPIRLPQTQKHIQNSVKHLSQ